MKQPLATLALMAITSSVHALTYYVDSASGSDSNRTGTLPSPTAANSDGPWQTLAKVSATVFSPGDSVLFKCGSVWREQLTVSSSGASGLPIVFGSYGGCTGNNKPLISGSAPVSGWRVHSGNIYVADTALAPSLVINGAFDTDMAGWNTWSSEHGEQKLWQADTSGGGFLKFTSSPGATSSNSLLTSNTFSVEQGTRYTVEFTLSGGQSAQTVYATVRRNGSPNYNVIGLNQKITVGTAWQKYSYSFAATSTEVKNARLDFNVAPGRFINVENVSIREVIPNIDNVTQIFVDGRYTPLAQHPNAGYLPQQPTNSFLTAAATSALAGGTSGSGYVTAGADLALSTEQGQDMAGAGIHIRTNNHTIEDRRIAAYSSTDRKLSLDAPTTYQVLAGWGYYLDNKLWMLDQPNEWYFDSAAGRLYLWAPDGNSPAARVEAGYRDYGILAKSRSNIVIDGLAIAKAGTGIDISGSANVVVKNSDITDSAASGLVAAGAIGAVIDRCTIKNSVRDGIQAMGAKNAAITRNTLVNTGTVGSPKQSIGAIRTTWDAAATIDQNTITNSGYLGLYFGPGDTITNNLFENSCLVLDDCGAVYGGRDLPGVTIKNNVIVGATGNANGRPVELGSSAQGIYLDQFANGVTVTGNTIVNTDYGFQLHKARYNTLEYNTVYNAKKSAVWLQQDTDSGSMHDNFFRFNRFFHTNNKSVLDVNSNFANFNLATFSSNRYYTGNPTQLVYESYKPADSYITNIYALSEWISIRTQDLGSNVFAPFSVASTRVVSTTAPNLITNSTLSSSDMSWSVYNGKKTWVASCAIGGCLQFTRDTQTAGLLISNSFSVQQGTSYVVKFDAKASGAALFIESVVRRTGTPDWKAIGLAKSVKISTGWQTYAMVFTASETRTFDPAIPGSGARLDFGVPAGQTIHIDNISIEKATVEKNTSADTNFELLLNKTAFPSSVDCPEAQTNPSKCSQYIYFSNETAVIWPVTLQPMSSEIVIWANTPWRDSDLDTVPDSVDMCANTAAESPVDERGCAFIQNHPA